MKATKDELMQIARIWCGNLLINTEPLIAFSESELTNNQIKVIEKEVMRISKVLLSKTRPEAVTTNIVKKVIQQSRPEKPSAQKQ